MSELDIVQWETRTLEVQVDAPGQVLIPAALNTEIIIWGFTLGPASAGSGEGYLQTSGGTVLVRADVETVLPVRGEGLRPLHRLPVGQGLSVAFSGGGITNWLVTLSYSRRRRPASGIVVERLGVTCTPCSWVVTNDSMADGTPGPTLLGTWQTFGTSHYGYYTQEDPDGNQVGVDPGQDEPLLAGMTAVPIPLPPGEVTAADVRAAETAALTLAGLTIESESGAEYVVSGFAGNASDSMLGPVAWLDADQRTRDGRLGLLAFSAGFGSFARSDEPEGSAILASRLPPGRFRIAGWRVGRGNVDTGQFQLSFYDGGVSNVEILGAVLLGTTPPSVAHGVVDGWDTFFLTPAQCIYLDGAALTRLWVMSVGEGATSQVRIVNGGGVDNDYENAGIIRMGAGIGFPGAWPDPAPATSNIVGGFNVSLQLLIQSEPYYSDTSWNTWLGIQPELNPTLPSDSPADNIFVRWLVTPPPVPSAVFGPAGVLYNTHDPGKSMGVAVYTNVVAQNDFTGEELLFDYGPVGGGTSDTGWVYESPPLDDIAVPQETFSISLRSQAGVDSSVNYRNGEGPTFQYRQAAYGGGLGGTFPDTETETAVAGPGNVETNENDPPTTPLNPDVLPLFIPGNSGGIVARILVPPKVLTPNP